MHEDTLLSCLSHKRIIKLIDTFDCADSYNMVLQKMDMDLVKYLITYDLSDNLKQKQRLFKMIAEGVSYIHSMKIVHFDLKLDNILVNVNSHGYVTDLCISDFGLSRSFKEFKNSLNFDGTWMYMAPEMYGVDKVFDEKIDCWSLGVILYTILK